jgi:hypothetical protein
MFLYGSSPTTLFPVPHYNGVCVTLSIFFKNFFNCKEYDGKKATEA